MRALLVVAVVFASVAHASMSNSASYLADVPFPVSFLKALTSPITVK